MAMLIRFFFDQDDEPANCYLNKDYFKEKMEKFLSKDEIDQLRREPCVENTMLCIKVYYMCLVKRRVVDNINLGYPIKMVLS